MLQPSYGFEIYLVNLKTIRKMAQICVAFSDELNFKGASVQEQYLFISKIEFSVPALKMSGFVTQKEKRQPDLFPFQIAKLKTSK